MFFNVISGTPTPSKSKVYLIEDAWDDWFEWSTTYSLVYFDENGNRNNIGAIKIGAFEMDSRRPNLKPSFNKIGDNFFSLGQSDTYYLKLNKLGEAIRDKILIGLNDIAKHDDIYRLALKKRVTKNSLLRSVSPTSVQGQFRRLANGNDELTPYEFIYMAAKHPDSALPTMRLSFQVTPESHPPTNIHVLIGRNGVGKTHLLNNMIDSLVEEKPMPSKVGKFIPKNIPSDQAIFANLVSVTFSAFDQTEPKAERRDKSKGIAYSYIGLKRLKNSDSLNRAPKSPVMLSNEFGKSIEACRIAGNFYRWEQTVKMLEADPIFKEAEVAKVTKSITPDQSAIEIFNKLSSGHKIVLLTITRLVETVEERSLVLLDEPEAHLHPPLLSAFIRALSDLLIRRNAVAIIATHSPVVLQEVPKSCVWKLRRAGAEAVAERLEIESFGENVGTLTREIFGLEVTHSGFHQMLIRAIATHDDYDEIVNLFGAELGMEAKAIVRTLLLLKNN